MFFCADKNNAMMDIGQVKIFCKSSSEYKIFFFLDKNEKKFPFWKDVISDLYIDWCDILLADVFKETPLPLIVN